MSIHSTITVSMKRGVYVYDCPGRYNLTRPLSILVQL